MNVTVFYNVNKNNRLHRFTLLNCHQKMFNLLRSFSNLYDLYDLLLYNQYFIACFPFTGIAYGAGTYFSTSSQYSIGFSHDRGDKCIIRAKVVTGRYCRGSPSVKNTPPGYHSTVDNESFPSMFVVYHDAAAYPEYVIKFGF